MLDWPWSGGGSVEEKEMENSPVDKLREVRSEINRRESYIESCKNELEHLRKKKNNLEKKISGEKFDGFVNEMANSPVVKSHCIDHGLPVRHAIEIRPLDEEFAEFGSDGHIYRRYLSTCEKSIEEIKSDPDWEVVRHREV